MAQEKKEGRTVIDMMSAKPSSTSDVGLRPSYPACFLARFNKSSFILKVVLMYQYILLMHQDVKKWKMVESEKIPQKIMKDGYVLESIILTIEEIVLSL